MLRIGLHGGAIYGEQRELPASEDHPEYPLSPYGVSKLAAERYLHFFEARYDLPYVALRYANVYGPRQDLHGKTRVVAIFASRPATTSTPGTSLGRTPWPSEAASRQRRTTSGPGSSRASTSSTR
jgi:nucleoside-diphosphate-sugar epimerase